MLNMKTDYLNDKVIIFGPNNLYKEFLIYILKNELSCNCIIQDCNLITFDSISRTSEDPTDNSILYLLDIGDEDFETYLTTVLTDQNKYFSDCYFALLNLEENSDIEKRALSKKIRGFFYKNDSLELFIKGIKSILSGEIWISREVLLKYAFNADEDKKSRKYGNSSLTSREIEILTLVSMGFSNEELSEKMCISINTVKTHLYNIFKKIDVQNRLQAALWAASHL